MAKAGSSASTRLALPSHLIIRAAKRRWNEPRLLSEQHRTLRSQGEQQLVPGGQGQSFRQYRLKPGLHTAMQRVIFDGLPMRAVCYRFNRLAINYKTGMAAAPVASAVFKMRVGRQVKPGFSERGEVGEISGGQQSADSGLRLRSATERRHSLLSGKVFKEPAGRRRHRLQVTKTDRKSPLGPGVGERD
jgi:hypothetical protein